MKVVNYRGTTFLKGVWNPLVFSRNWFFAESEGSESSTHYLGDKNRFDVSSKGPSSGISVNTV